MSRLKPFKCFFLDQWICSSLYPDTIVQDIFILQITCLKAKKHERTVLRDSVVAGVRAMYSEKESCSSTRAMHFSLEYLLNSSFNFQFKLKMFFSRFSCLFFCQILSHFFIFTLNSSSQVTKEILNYLWRIERENVLLSRIYFQLGKRFVNLRNNYQQVIKLKMFFEAIENSLDRMR